jgi:asparagine synthase (glutamine-hydrolysing)
MTPIAGVWNRDGRPADLPLLGRMGSALMHRGPNRSPWCHHAFGSVSQVGLATSRLADERQLTIAGEHTTLIFDGRLDNREELLSMLCVQRVECELSDSELVLAAYRHWDSECFSRLQGDFAIAVFDGPRQQLTLARDPIGYRPLYYWTNGSTCVFAPEIKAILIHPEVIPRPNEDLLADHLCRDRLAYEDYGETFFQNIFAVLPGRRVTVSAARIEWHTFWDFDTESAVSFPSYSDYAERLRELLFQAVGRRLRSADPVAIAVSGGLDSSVVLCVADDLCKHGQSNASLRPVSLRAPGAEVNEETQFLSLLESTRDLRIERLPLGPPGEPADLEEAAWHSEWPRFDDGWCAQQPMFAWAKAERARTMLTGHWSDQLLFRTGYLSDLFIRLRWREIGSHLDEYTRWFVDADPGYFRARFARELVFNLAPHRFRARLRPFLPRRYRRTGDAMVSAAIVARITRPRPTPPRPRCRSAHARDLYQTIRGQTHRLQFEADQKLAASFAIECTTPFLDRDLIAYLIAVPGEIQNRGGVPRALLREAMRGTVPDPILSRRWRNDDHVARARDAVYLSTLGPLETAHATGFLEQPVRLTRQTIDFAGLEFWSRAFFSDRLSPPQQSPNGVPEVMDTADPAPKDDRDKLPYSPPKLTVHGDLRTITAAKQSDRSETGQPKTFSSGMP